MLLRDRRLRREGPLDVALMGGGGYTWYVDSVAGNDANDGKTAGSAFQTIAAVEAAGISSGDSIGLARGAHWRELLEITVNNVTVAAYGTGALPIIDGLDIATNVTFTKTAGQTNVYELEITVAAGVTDATVHCLEDDTMLRYKSSIALCDSAVGSYYVTGHSGTVTLYVHASDSSNVTTNGKTYEFSARSGPLEMYQSEGGRMLYLNHRCGLGNSRVGVNGQATGCEFRNGGKHNFYARVGARIEDCAFIDAESAAVLSGTMLVINDNVFAGEHMTVRNCTFEQTTGDARIAAANSHHNVSGDLGSLTLVACTFTGFDQAISSFNHVTAINITECSWVNNKRGFATPAAPASGCTFAITGGSWSSNIDSQRFGGTSAGASLVVDGVTCEIAGTVDVGFLILAGTEPATVQDCIFTRSTSGNGIGVYTQIVNSGLTLQRNTWSGAFTWTRIYRFELTAAGMTWTSDYNAFGPAFGWDIFGVTYATFADYKLGTGQDANSTIVA